MRWSGEVAALNEVADDDVTEEVVGMVPTTDEEEEWEGGGLGVTALKLFCGSMVSDPRELKDSGSAVQLGVLFAEGLIVDDVEVDVVSLLLISGRYAESRSLLSCLWSILCKCRICRFMLLLHAKVLPQMGQV